MDTTVQTLLNSVLALPEKDRAHLAQELLASLSPQDETPEDEEAFLAELERRSEEARRDPSKSKSWEEVRSRLRS